VTYSQPVIESIRTVSSVELTVVCPALLLIASSTTAASADASTMASAVACSEERRGLNPHADKETAATHIIAIVLKCIYAVSICSW
jgi:hypothetical protein